MSTLTLVNGCLVLQSRYDPNLVAGIKALPVSDRKYDPANRTWQIDPVHGRTVADLVRQYLGESVIVPASQTASKTETRILDVRYIGQTKDRGADERSAFAWVSGKWAAIFPEAVLRDWFDAPKRPDEEATLYQVLSVKRDAQPDEIKSAYRRLSRQWHPDVCREPGAAEVFIKIKSAYDLLSDPSKRARYDAGLALAASLPRFGQVETGIDALQQTFGYRSPLRCGLLMCEGVERLGRFVVSKIMAWEDVTDGYGRTLSTSWPMGAEQPVEVWL